MSEFTEYMGGILKENPNHCVVDVGAYIGKVARELCETSQGNPANYYLFEPCPENYEILVKKCPEFNCHQCAISFEVGEEILFTANHPKSLGSSQCNSFFADFVDDKAWNNDTKEIKVSTLTLDHLHAYVLDSPKIDLLKINCEGAELHIFEGTLNFLQYTDHIYIELHGKHKRFLTDESIKAKINICNKIQDAGFELIMGERPYEIPYIDTHILQLWSKPKT